MAGAEGPSESPPTLLQHTLASEPLFSRMVQAGAASTQLPVCSQGPHHCLSPRQALLNGSPLQEDPSREVPSREVPAAHNQHQDS